MAKVSNEELIKVVQIYNDEGRSAAYDFLRNQYSVKNPYFVIKRISNDPRFEYDQEKDHFLIHSQVDPSDVFISMEELCSPVVTEHYQPSEKQKMSGSRSAQMEKLIQELLGDRLLELTKYISLDSSSKTMMIDHTSLESAGYRIVTY